MSLVKNGEELNLVKHSKKFAEHHGNHEGLVHRKMHHSAHEDYD